MRSLGWLVARLSPVLLADAAYRLGPMLRAQYEPEDLVNEAWLVALPKLAELQARDGRYAPVLVRFLSTTMALKINNLLRKQARRGPRDSQPSSGAVEADFDALEQYPADVTGAVTHAVRSELVDQVRQSLDELPEKDREVIVLRGVQGQPSKTVAVLLESTPAAIDQRYRRALARLRGTLPDSIFADFDEDEQRQP